ncbi:uncharacterized protein LOC133195710 [Saccostrea echinata]|uniref:uncharacterized protein LOC133195710 n=1 Tax=Saccostrea echinata TaxID=191078 RepID=UPI002A7FCC8B|nr:uncharacterized protein LOC133195710 [Saccostrea echinata]
MIMDALRKCLRLKITSVLRQRILTKRFWSSKPPASLTSLINSALADYKDLQLAPLKIKSCSIGGSFSRAHLEYELITVKDNNDLVLCENFSNIYSQGFSALRQSVGNVGVGFFDSPTGNENGYFYALSALRNFLIELDHHEMCLKQRNPYGDAFDKQTEVVVAVLLTNHLLSRLVYGNRYLISNDYKGRPVKCPCLKPLDCASLINYGQTGLGCEEIWYGHPDIVLVPPRFSYIPLCFIGDDPEDELQEDEGILTKDCLQENCRSTDICEVKGAKLIFEKCAEQILSQAITFSFCEANAAYADGKGLFSPTLVPSLVLTPLHYYIVMYDYENDILLSSGHQPASLWDESGVRFNLSAILQIWMVLNHCFFGPKLNDTLLKDFSQSCNFHKILKELQVFDKTKDISYSPSFRQKETSKAKTKKHFMLYSEYIKLDK